MSSILEALKKLEAEKNAQHVAIPEPEPVYTTDQMAQSLLGYAEPAPDSRRLSPLFLVLGGGVFTMLLIGVSVALAVLVLRNTPATETTIPPVAAVATVPPPVAPAVTAVTPESAPVSDASPVESTPAAPKESPKKIATPVKLPEVTTPRPEPERPVEVPMDTTPLPDLTEARYEPYIPKPPSSAERGSTPVPDDIRKLPMLSRSERAQYRLDGLTINMLNEANATRPLANALINLEKIFIGETLPGSNATLIDVKSHGIAIEIMSSGQRYYLPR
jgi:hypothetical protein